MNYSPTELMISASARELRGARVAFVGVGLPNIVCNLAQRLHSSGLQLVYEAGVFGARPARLPLSIGDPTLVTGALSVSSMPELFQYYLQRGLIDVGFIGAAQIDRFGNINTTVIGPYDKPKVRLPGSGGATDIALLCDRTLVIMRLSKRAFPERVDFVTSPGFLQGGESRQKLNARGSGPQAVITDFCTFHFDAATKEMILGSIHPGTTLEYIRSQVGWDLPVTSELRVTPPPTPEELRLIRDELDPQGLYSHP